MKVQVSVIIPANKEQASTLELICAETDTVASIKERVATWQLIPFPDQDLMFDGEVLAESQQLFDCGIKEQCSLDLVVKASEATLVEQLKVLLQARDLSSDELSLLYCYKHGVSITQALQMLGLSNEKLQDFVKRHKAFQLQNNHVALVRKDTSLKPFSLAEEVESILKATGTRAMDVKELCAKFVAKFNVSLASIAGTKPIDFLLKDKERFVVVDRRLVSLKRGSCGGSPEPALPPPSLVPPPPGLGSEAAVKEAEAANEPAADSLSTTESQQYLELHQKVCSRSFYSKATQALAELVDAVQEVMFLNVDRVVKGGSVGKGTALSSAADAEVVFFLRGLPPGNHERWLPPLLRAVAGGLADRLGEEKGVETIKVTEDSVQLCTKTLVSVDLRFSPVFGSYAETVQALGMQGPEARRFYSASLVEERVQFIARQPPHVKVTIRLLKWWRDQQSWSTKLVRPSDDILELMAVYSAVQTKPQDQRAAIANVMSLLARFDELRIVWSNYYTKSDVWAPLLRQRPLLMDPVNPFVNIADPQAFDARDLMDLARTTHFFW